MNAIPCRLNAADRQSIENEIERLIGLLDGMDGDTDLEPWLGWPNDGLPPNTKIFGDREHDDCDLEDGADSEPDLGWTEGIDQQRRLQTLPGWKVEDGESDPVIGFPTIQICACCA